MTEKKIWKSVSGRSSGMDAETVVLELAGSRKLTTTEGKLSDVSYEEAFHDPYRIPDFGKAIERILLAQKKHEKIAIYGDYDVDGVTSSAILAETFENIGIDTQVFLPHREDDGYGLNIEAIKKIAKTANLLVAIDNGTSAHEAIDLAVKKGIEVIVIDHHVVPAVLPKALVVNQHRSDSEYPFSGLCAAGLAYKFSRCLLAHFDREDEAKWLMDLAALGTIADRVPMNSENRYIVKFGLKVFAVTRRLGLISLLARSGMFKDNIDAENLAFKIIPRLNAAGRMQHADLAYALIRTKDHLVAEKLTLELDSLNNNRRTITASAIKEIKEKLDCIERLPDIIFLSGDWPVGILGILAGKLADEYQRPAAVVNVGDEFCTGSIRGNGLVDVMEILSGAKDLFTKFGGHFTAGGFSFATRNMAKITNYFGQLKAAFPEEGKQTMYDLEIDTSIINLDFTETLKKLEPHGEGNSRPVFLLKNLKIVDFRDIGANKDHKRFIFHHADFLADTLAGVAFYWKKDLLLEIGLIVDVLCELKINNFRGNTNVDIVVVDMRISEQF